MSDAFRAAILSQPENLAAAREAFTDAVAGIALDPWRRGTLVFSGIGASAHALTPAVLALRAARRRAFAVSPDELGNGFATELGDAFVLVSQSGASTEILDAVAQLDGAPVIAISAHGDSPLAEAAEAWIPLGPLDDTEVATLSYTASLQATGMLCDALLGTSSGWAELPGLASSVLERCAPTVAETGASFVDVVAVDAVGRGGARASAGEAALLVREGLRLPAVGMETREYLHGPLEAVTAGFGCVLFGEERECELAAELASFGACTMLITEEGDGPHRGAGPFEIQIPSVSGLAAPILQILPVQLLVDDLARLRGTEIGKLRRQQPDTKVA